MFVVSRHWKNVNKATITIEHLRSRLPRRIIRHTGDNSTMIRYFNCIFLIIYYSTRRYTVCQPRAHVSIARESQEIIRLPRSKHWAGTASYRIPITYIWLV